GQQQEQVELLAGERHGLVLDGDLAGADLDPDRAEVERGVGGAHGAGQPGAAQHGVDAGQQFGDAERLDDVVVGAGAQAADPFVLLRARGHGDDGGFGAVAQLADHVEPIAVGQAQVDEDDVGGVGAHGLRGGGEPVDLESGLGQDGHQATGHAVVIFDDGDPHTGLYDRPRGGAKTSSWDFCDISHIPWDSSDTTRASARPN